MLMSLTSAALKFEQVRLSLNNDAVPIKNKVYNKLLFQEAYLLTYVLVSTWPNGEIFI